MKFSQSRFEDLARFVAHEDRPGDQGLEMSRITQDAYLGMLHEFYDPMMEDFFNQDIDGRLTEPRMMISDVPRTIYMMRALMRTIEAIKEKRPSGPIHVAEAGTGSGFLATVAAALDPRVVVSGFDIGTDRIQVSESFAGRMGYTHRTTFERRDLISKPFKGDVDIVIAEHLCRGLHSEPATDIPRSFKINPNFVIPYSVKPGVVWGPKLFLEWNSLYQRTNFLFERPRDEEVDYGDEIVLGDDSDPENFYVEGRRSLPMGFSPILVANDIRWASPKLKGKPLYQDQSFNGQDPEREFTWTNHLIGPDMLRRAQPKTYGELEKRKFETEYFGFVNLDYCSEPTDYRVYYPFGATSGRKNIEPNVEVDHPLIQVHKGGAIHFGDLVNEDIAV